MKIREWWRKIRLRTFEGDDRPVDNIDAMSTTAGAGVSDTGGVRHRHGSDGLGSLPTRRKATTLMKLRELLNKLRRRSPAKDGERSSDAVDKAFTDSYEQAASTWLPSQQDRPRH